MLRGAGAIVVSLHFKHHGVCGPSQCKHRKVWGAVMVTDLKTKGTGASPHIVSVEGSGGALIVSSCYNQALVQDGTVSAKRA